jgi:hypothetical protein
MPADGTHCARRARSDGYRSRRDAALQAPTREASTKMACMAIRHLQANIRPDSRPFRQYWHLRLDIPRFRQEPLHNLLLKYIG